MNKPNQRKGSASNAHVGAEFEEVALAYFKSQGIVLRKNHPVELGVCGTKKQHRFDLGCASARIIVECKSHTWTEGHKVPSAKLTVWNEAMYYFHLAPDDFRKVLFVRHHRRQGTEESLLGYYKRTYGHLVPEHVGFVEYDEEARTVIGNENRA